MRQLARNSEFAAMLALQESIELAFLGCRFDRGLVGSIAVTRWATTHWVPGGTITTASNLRQQAFNRAEYTVHSLSRKSCW